MIVIVTLYPIGIYSGVQLQTSTLIALAVCLIPTTIGGLLSAIGIAGMDRVTRFNVIAMSGKAVEACGDVDTMILDKTGTLPTAIVWLRTFSRWEELTAATWFAVPPSPA